jgi:two-component system LytT family response regulator
MTIRCLIADDEPLARERLRTLLREEPDMEIVAECPDGPKTVAAVHKHAPDLLFLDVQMPALDGFGVLEALPAEKIPVLIFVTAYDQYALQAFEAQALDYLLKPFDRERFRKALRRARDQVRRRHESGINPRVIELLESLQARKKYADRLVVRAAGRVWFLRVEEIDWIEAAGNYVKLHAGKEAHLLRETMNAMEARLDPATFRRIHRSTIVHLERIKEMHPWFKGDYVVILRDGTRLTLSRNYREGLLKPQMNADERR